MDHEKVIHLAADMLELASSTDVQYGELVAAGITFLLSAAEAMASLCKEEGGDYITSHEECLKYIENAVLVSLDRRSQHVKPV